MHPSLGALGVVLVLLIHLNICLGEAEKEGEKEGCCKKQMKAFWDANPKDPEFQAAVLEPNATTCSVAQDVLQCYVNCTKVDVDHEPIKRLIFAYTDYYCKEEKPIQEALQCYKDAENQALANSTNECFPILNEAEKSEYELRTNKPVAITKYCVTQGEAQQCMEKDKNVMQCSGIAGLYYYLQLQIRNRNLMLNTTDTGTLTACASYEKILVEAEMHAKVRIPKKSRMCCDNELKFFNPNPITNVTFQKPIFSFAKMECMASNATLTCFEKCLTNEPENEYAKQMSSVFVYFVNYCDKKEVFNQANQCFDRVDEKHLCANKTLKAKGSFENMVGNNDVETLQTTCQAMDSEIQCVSEEEKAKGNDEKCSNDIYRYYEYLVQIKIALIHAIHASQGLPLDEHVGDGCQDFLGDLKHLLHDEPLPPHSEATLPIASDSTTTPGEFKPSKGSDSPGNNSPITNDPTATAVSGHNQPLDVSDHTNNPSDAPEPGSPDPDATTDHSSAKHMVYSRHWMGVIGLAVYLLF